MKKTLCILAALSVLKLGTAGAASNAKALLPLVPGWFNDAQVLYIQTEASDPAVALAQNVNYVPRLAGAANTNTVDDIYVFTNFQQPNVVASAPNPLGPMNADPVYSPLWQVNTVTWNPGVTAQQLTSEAAIIAAASSGKLAIQKTGVIVNCPIVYAPAGGTLPTARVIGDSTQKSVILPLVQGWFNGSQVLYLQTEASDAAVAQAQNVNYVPRLAGAANTGTADDIYVISNFPQPNVVASAPHPLGPMNADPVYSPLWQVNMVTWNPGATAQLLTSEMAIIAAASSGNVTIQKTGIIVNCPIIASALPTATLIGEPEIGAARTASGLVLTYSGILQAANSAAGPWTDVPGDSPQTVPMIGAGKFFRAKQ